MTHTETHIAFRTYSRHDLEAAFASATPSPAEDSRGPAETARPGPGRAGRCQPAGPGQPLAGRAPSGRAAPPGGAGVERRGRPGVTIRQRLLQLPGSATPAAAASAAAALRARCPGRARAARPARRGPRPRCAPRRRRAGRRAWRASPSAAGSSTVWLTAPRVDHPDRGRVRRGQLVQPVVAVEHQRRAAALGQHPGDDRAHARIGDPDRLRPGRAGLATGPRKLKTVGTPSSRRGSGGVAAGRVVKRREQERDADLLGQLRAGLRRQVITTPSASSTSAAPQAEEAARLPCLAIRAPAAAATIAPMVEMLTVCAAVAAGARPGPPAGRAADRGRVVQHRLRPGPPSRRPSHPSSAAPRQTRRSGRRRRAIHDLVHRPGGLAPRSAPLP